MVHIHLDEASLDLIKALLAAGAKQIVCLACAPALHMKRATIEALKRMRRVQVVTEESQLERDEFDIGLSCGDTIPPRVTLTAGCVEQTKTSTAPDAYSERSYPTISVDESRVKVAEVELGTPDGLVRVLDRLVTGRHGAGTAWAVAATKLAMRPRDGVAHLGLRGAPMMVLGAGKVGASLAATLARTYEARVLLVDSDKDAESRVPGVCSDASRGSVDFKHSAILHADDVTGCALIVTATGHRDSLHGLLAPIWPAGANYSGLPLVVNMGTEDETFTIRERGGTVFDDGKIANFALERPTRFELLDMVITAMFLCAVLLRRSERAVRRGKDSPATGLIPFGAFRELEEVIARAFDAAYAGTEWQGCLRHIFPHAAAAAAAKAI